MNRLARFFPLLLILWAVLSCKTIPAVEEAEPFDPSYAYDTTDSDLDSWSLDDLYGESDWEGESENEGEGDWGAGGSWETGDDDPSLSLPPGIPLIGETGELPEPLFEYGEAFLPGTPTEIILGELPEPLAPELPGLVQEPSAPVIAEPEPPAPASSETPVPAEPAGPPPLPPRLVRPSAPIPPPPLAREPIPLPVNPIPASPAMPPPGSSRPSSTLVPATPLTPEPSAASMGNSSRVIRARVGQTIEVPFRGTGWVYLGESASKTGVDYSSRRLDTEGQTFVFRAGATGEYELKFYRQDFLRDYIINDSVKLIVEEASAAALPFGVPLDRGVVVAEPRWPPVPGTPAEAAIPPAPPGPASSTRPAAPATPRAAVPGQGSAAQAPAVPATARPASPEGAVGTFTPEAAASAADQALIVPEGSLPEEYLRRARAESEAGRIPQALNILDQFRSKFPLGSDEAWWLYAQLYEAPGSERDIRAALDYYRRLVNEYPQSLRYADAKRRIAYLERYYINIQ
ncbi:putative lipoprotein [Treponema primitia ZAS-2]|uniref:Putative lipoprotein n=1 Tax=Treponema primitia (strain ATCC BAA-887 / DSM 12427 / ZAS-2) TaxID=545694 RepID=F5YPI1_TREPZ|nr:tetratricopeptide repeat protein [Treponema primitia]AEF86893.1 putative lipoprotein [Treponema primitia ZAS-2]